jgi:hypothetical protein
MFTYHETREILDALEAAEQRARERTDAAIVATARAERAERERDEERNAGIRTAEVLANLNAEWARVAAKKSGLERDLALADATLDRFRSALDRAEEQLRQAKADIAVMQEDSESMPELRHAWRVIRDAAYWISQPDGPRSENVIRGYTSLYEYMHSRCIEPQPPMPDTFVATTPGPGEDA